VNLPNESPPFSKAGRDKSGPYIPTHTPSPLLVACAAKLGRRDETDQVN